MFHAENHRRNFSIREQVVPPFKCKSNAEVQSSKTKDTINIPGILCRFVTRGYRYKVYGVTLAQLVKASVGQADVRRFEPHLGHNWLSCGVFLVKSRHFGLPLAQTIRPNWQFLLILAGGSVAIQTWSIYKVYT